MVSEIAPSTNSVGLRAAVPSTVFSITYDIGQIAEWMGWMDPGEEPW